MGGRGLDATERCEVAQWEAGSSWGVAAAGAAGGPSCCGRQTGTGGGGSKGCGKVELLWMARG